MKFLAGDILCALDPGETTGFILAKVLPEIEPNRVNLAIFGRDFHGFDAAVTALCGLHPEVLVIEDYISRIASANPALEIIGFYRYYQQILAYEFVRQKPACQIYGKARLKDIRGTKLSGKHQLSALKHLIYYIESFENVLVAELFPLIINNGAYSA